MADGGAQSQLTVKAPVGDNQYYIVNVVIVLFEGVDQLAMTFEQVIDCCMESSDDLDQHTVAP